MIEGLSREDSKKCVGKGWALLIDTIYDHVEADRFPKLQPVAVNQVKEKFGGLRFYFSGGDDPFFHFVEGVCAVSYRLCERCGRPGRMRDGGWVLTLCDECEAKK